MKIKNTTVANLSVCSAKTTGSAHKRYMTVPGEATLELGDDVWKEEFAGPAAKMIEAGNLVITEAPALTEEEIAAAEEAAVKAAEALIAKKASKTAKATPKADTK